jgi:hypothetical protein
MRTRLGQGDGAAFTDARGSSGDKCAFAVEAEGRCFG